MRKVKPHNRKTKRGKIVKVRGYVKSPVEVNFPRKKDQTSTEGYYSKVSNADLITMGR